MLMTRTSAVLVGGGLLTALIASPALLRTSGAPAETVRPFVQASGVVDEASALHLEPLLARRVAAQPAPASRNPFVFGSRPAPPPPAPPAAPAPAIVEAPVAPPRPPITLGAIASESGDNGAVIRTAVLSVAGQVFLVKEGERISSRFSILRISAEVVELRDEAADTVIRLALR
jgi:hypothetical protein